MLAVLISDALGLSLDPRLRLRGPMSLVNLTPTLLESHSNDVRLAVLSVLGDVGRFASATETINVSRLGSADESQNSGALREAEQQLEALHDIRMATGRSAADIAAAWLQRFCRVREQTMVVGIPNGPDVQIVIPVRQRVVPTRTMGAARPQLIRYADEKPRLVSPCIVVRTIEGGRIVIPTGRSVPTLSIGSRIRITAEDIRRANHIDVLRGARPSPGEGGY